jgi:hypothetical protein
LDGLQLTKNILIFDIEGSDSCERELENKKELYENSYYLFAFFVSILFFIKLNYTDLNKPAASGY